MLVNYNLSSSRMMSFSSVLFFIKKRGRMRDKRNAMIAAVIKKKGLIGSEKKDVLRYYQT